MERRRTAPESTGWDVIPKIAGRGGRQHTASPQQATAQMAMGAFPLPTSLLEKKNSHHKSDTLFLLVINLFCLACLTVVVQGDLTFAILLHAPECLDYRPVQSCLIRRDELSFVYTYCVHACATSSKWGDVRGQPVGAGLPFHHVDPRDQLVNLGVRTAEPSPQPISDHFEKWIEVFR